ncbi:hypothetical protein Nepgr_017026 [Nepenthes gracilis]|uniref:Uncharacterized protein n=1 Tax=Nepenthes gracilis TaxID=150966 RepID=A0AAD3SNN8_NEPGR|nr:hypothetical protein Nepgr_017026 [Nepenthes gracilis]
MKILVSFFVLIFASLLSVSVSGRRQSTGDPLTDILGDANLGPLKRGILDEAQAPGPGGNGPQRTLVLAGNRTKRPDILDGFKRYQGGWDIANKHYWASVAFTGASGFIFAALWLVSFGVLLVVHHCCGCRIHVKGKRSSLKICLVLLIVSTCGSAIGCILLFVGQDEFHDEVLHTLNYVVNQSDYTVEMLRNVTEYLYLAKTINLSQVILPSNVENNIDELSVDLNSAAETLTEKTSENAAKIKRVFNIVRSALITVAVLMLLLALLGLVLSLLGHQQIHIFIFSGWLLVAVTFFLCGIFMIFNNAITDTCMAMQEWVDNPQAETTLSDILPCVDERTTNQTLIQSKKVVAGIVDVVNQFIYTYADTDRPRGDYFYYNQSGPLMPPLCYPFDDQLQDRVCMTQEVSMMNASLVWKTYVCNISTDHLCSTVGRLTPAMYDQLVVAVNVSYAIRHYTPPMLSLQNCKFVHDTFMKITSSYCPPLEHYLRMVDVGLGLISVGVMLCLVLWVLCENSSRTAEELPVKLSMPSGGSSNHQEGGGGGGHRKDGDAN